MDKRNLNRRNFLHVSGISTGVLLAGSHSASVLASLGANDTLRVGIVGPGGRGTSLMNDFFKAAPNYNARMTAICDIWNKRREAAAARVKEVHGTEPKVYRHIEELLSDKDIDAVIIATADHQHAQMLKMAVEAGKDVYVEKPMANVLEEANATLAAVKKSGRIVQNGTQRRCYPKYRQAEKLMRQGVLGDVVKVDLNVNFYSPYRWAHKPEQLAEVKEADTDWKAFLLGKPYRPFDPKIYRSFRLFREFSSGIIDQWMTHLIDVVHFLTGYPYPNSAVAHGGIYAYRDYRENPDNIQVVLEYGQGDKRFLATYATCLTNGAGNCVRVLGTRGTLEVEDVWRLSGEGSKAPDRIQTVQEIGEAPGTLDHMSNWLDCTRRRDGQSLYAPVEAGYGHSIACILSADALWSGRRMVFDPQKQAIRPA
jgi:predicted dehydrogenase